MSEDEMLWLEADGRRFFMGERGFHIRLPDLEGQMMTVSVPEDMTAVIVRMDSGEERVISDPRDVVMVLDTIRERIGSLEYVGGDDD